MKPPETVREPSLSPAQAEDELHEEGMPLLEYVLGVRNRRKALKHIEGNKGAKTPGVDGMPVAELRPYLDAHWPEVRDALLAGTYEPSPVRRVEIPKPGGGKRLLGIPTALDRLIQQALLQVLTPIFDRGFSEKSYGFRRGRRGHDAVRTARRYVREGYGWVVDIDLDRFFDRVNHDKLMARVARKVKDPRVLALIRKYLESGVLLDGVKVATEEGTPQGGPLSPLLSNIMLDDLDRELEKRGHHFVRYADDCNIYVRTQRAAERVMEGVKLFLERVLSLRVNVGKSAVDRPWNRKFLGFSLLPGEEAKIRLSRETLARVKARIREMTRSRRTLNMEGRIHRLNEYLGGWLGYFALAELPGEFQRLDGWIRRRLRACQWRLWKRVRTRYRELRKLGLSHVAAIRMANTRKGSWRISKSPPLSRALPNAHWASRGLLSLAERYRTIRNDWRTAGCGSACPVV